MSFSDHTAPKQQGLNERLPNEVTVLPCPTLDNPAKLQSVDGQHHQTPESLTVTYP